MTNINDIIEDLASDKSFQSLQRSLRNFNIFEATNMKHQEIKHTQFLAHILDPNQSHGLGDRVLFEFLSLIPKHEKNNIKLMDLNLGLAIISTEILIKDTNKEPKNFWRGNQIDLIIEIPRLSKPEECYLIVVENKLRSSQGDNQLIRYKDTIKEKYKNGYISTFLFLTLQGESPDDDEWVSVSYTESVLSAISIVLDEHKEVMSDYMRSILLDYCNIIEPEFIGLTEKISPSKQIELHNKVKELNNAKNNPLIFIDPISYRSFECRYAQALNYFKDYDSDPRNTLFKKFSELFCVDGLYKHQFPSDFNIRQEDSGKTYLRFTITSSDSEKYLKSISDGARKWLSSGRHLAYEIYVAKKNESLNLSTRFILGPTNPDTVNRELLFKAIREKWNASLESRDPTNFWTVIEKNAHANFATEISLAELYSEDNAVEDKLKDLIDKVLSHDKDKIMEINKLLSNSQALTFCTPSMSLDTHL